MLAPRQNDVAPKGKRNIVHKAQERGVPLEGMYPNTSNCLKIYVKRGQFHKVRFVIFRSLVAVWIAPFLLLLLFSMK